MNGPHATRAASLARGLSGLAATVLLVAGVPVGLWRLAGWPLPRTLPSLADITRALGDSYVSDEVILNTLAVVCWLAWAQLSAAVALEAAAAIRARPARRIPFGGPAQRLAAQLVTAITLLGAVTETPSIAPALALPAVELTATPYSTQPESSSVPDSVGSLAEPQRPLPTHEVRPRDDLWSIAERRLGDPYRWRDIWELNKQRAMADGQTFHHPDVIHPGWILDLPADAIPLPDRQATIAPPPPDRGVDSQGPEANGVGMPEDDPAAEPAACTAASQEASLSTDPPQAADLDGPASGPEPPAPVVTLPSGAIVGGAFAAGVAAALATARLHRRRRYQPGDPRPGVSHHDPLTTPLVSALRRAARPAPADTDAPVIDLDTDPQPAATAVHEPREPGTVVVGERYGQPVAIDLIATGGLAVSGDAAPGLARAIVSELLAATPRTASVLITGRALAEQLVGRPPDLEHLTVAEPEAALTLLEVELIQRARILEAADIADYRTLARARPEEPTPLLLVVTDQPSDGRWDTILRLGPRLGIVGLSLHAGSPLPRLVIDDEGRISAVDPAGGNSDLLGTRVANLTINDTADVLNLLAASQGQPSVVGVHEPSPAEPASPPATSSTDTLSTPVMVTLFGPVGIQVNGAIIDRGLRAKARELLAYLLLHPRGASLEAAMEALWPDADPQRGVEWFRTVLGNLRSTLRQASGKEHAPFITRVADRYQADPELIDCDLWRFEHALAAAQAAEDETATGRALAEAVAAYTGDLAEASYYEWAEAAREDLRRRALDAAARLAELHERAGDNDAALAALERAIGIDPYAEELYRRTMRLQAACGRPDAVRRIYRYLETRLAELDVDPDPATQRLLAELATPATPATEGSRRR